MTTFVSLAISDTMFPDNAELTKAALMPDNAAYLIEHDDIASALNPNHTTTVDAIRRKFGIDLPIPDVAPKVALVFGDRLIVIQAQFKRRLAEGERFTDDEVNAAAIKFSLWSVL